MYLETKKETSEAAVLRVLADVDSTTPATLFRIVAESEGHAPRAISNAILFLIRENLISQTPGGRGHYSLTEAGQAYLGISIQPRTLEEIIPHPGGEAFDIERGELAIGTDVTGAVKRWQLWDSIGTIPCLAIGITGAGGTGLLGGIVEAMLPYHPETRVWMIDDNRQMREYWDRVEKVAVNEFDDRDEMDLTSIREMLDQIIQVQNDRARMLARIGQKTWTGPSRRLPLGVLIVGQLSEVANDYELRAKLTIITRMARKTGILVAAHASSAMLMEFGGDVVLQDYFSSGNILMLRTGSKPIGRMVTETMELFKPIPRSFDNGSTTAGLGYTSDGTLMRAFWASGL